MQELALFENSLSYENFRRIQPSAGGKIMSDGKSGDVLVAMSPEAADKVTGMEMLPQDFLNLLGIEDHEGEIAQRLLSDQKGSFEDPVFAHEEQNFSIKVINGSFTDEAVNLSLIAAKESFDNPNAREKYQRSALNLYKETVKSDQDYDMVIDEDCIASGETIVGVIADKLLKSEEISRIRINAIVAATPGMAIIREFAKANNLKIDTNVAFLAYGLTPGVINPDTGVKEHANYIKYPQAILPIIDQIYGPNARDIEEVDLEYYFGSSAKQTIKTKELIAPDGHAYVVGDMGDAFKSLPAYFNSMCAWNLYRNDDHGPYKGSKTFSPNGHNLNPIYYFANGGHLLKAFDDHLQIDGKRHMLQAKRVWDKQYGFSVLITY